MDFDTLTRPMPPDELVRVSADHLFSPAGDLMAWLRHCYVDEDGPLYNQEHSHLGMAEIAAIWTNVEHVSKGTRIVGQAEMGTAGGRIGNKWARKRAEYQLRQWFGYDPDFVLTIDATWASSAGMAEFCALIDHQLYHCAQETDDHGMPKFNQVTGRPRYRIRDHDVSEFVGVVRRFGIEAAGEAATDMVIAAAHKPEISSAKLAQACGTCSILRAA